MMGGGGGVGGIWSLDGKKFIHELYMFRLLVLCWVCRNLWSMTMLWSRVILSWWRSRETSTHIVVLVGWVFHWHRKCCFMALAPHLSLYIMVLVFIMACIGLQLAGSTCCGGLMITWLLVFVIGLLIGTCCGGGLWVVGGLCGKSYWACPNASLIIFGAVLIFFWIYGGIRFVGCLGFGFGWG